MAEPSATPAPYVFLSYSSPDRERVLALADGLQRAGVRVWLDRRNLVGGSSWDAAIVRAIKDCTVFAVLCSTAAAASRNVTQELRLAWQERRAILPLLLEAVPFPDEMRYILAGRQWVELLDRPEAAWLPQLLGALAHLHVITAGMTAPPERPPVADSPPPPRRPMGRAPLVGRDHELTLLQQRVMATVQGQGGVVFIAGEPGIGKTRLAEEAATAAELWGARVLWGRCYEGEGAPAYWPWVQIIRAYLQTHDRQTRQQVLATSPVIAQMVPELQEEAAVPSAAPVLDSAQARFRLFDGITTFLHHAAALQPLVLILDDLHWADVPSLLLLQFVARDVRAVPLLITGTYRDEEIDRHHPLAQTIASTLRQRGGERLLLTGLAEPEVARLLAAVSEHDASQTQVAAVQTDTDGNPFFIIEIARLLAGREPSASGQAAVSWNGVLPRTVRDVVLQRLERLSAACNHMLTIAAVIGRDFTVSVLQRVHELGGQPLLEVIEEAEASRIITAVPDAPGHYRFVHALVRTTLYESLPSARRVRLHRQVGEALEAFYGTRAELHLAELAHHFLQAVPGGTATKAATYARLVGDRALAALAYEDAVTHYERALQALALSMYPKERHVHQAVSGTTTG